jgi:phospholipid transport system substrate-binding protein
MPSLSRRAFLALSTSLCLLAASGLSPARAQAGGSGQAFVKSFADRLVAIVNGPQDAAAKKAALGPVIDNDVDVDAIARFCLGRFWANATPAQRQKYTALFHQVLLNNISGHLGEYQGVSFTMTGEHAQGSDTLVGTVINRPNEPPANVEWVVSTTSGSAKVIDVVAEGTSLRLTQRQDYASYLSRHNADIDALLAGLQRQLAGS